MKLHCFGVLNGSQPEVTHTIIHLQYRFHWLLTSCSGFYTLRKSCAGGSRNHRTAGIHTAAMCDSLTLAGERKTAWPLHKCYILQHHGCLLATVCHNSSVRQSRCCYYCYKSDWWIQELRHHGVVCILYVCVCGSTWAQLHQVRQFLRWQGAAAVLPSQALVVHFPSLPPLVVGGPLLQLEH